MVAVVYTTVGNIQDGRKIAHTLVEEQIVACVNIIPNIESVYTWKGKVDEANEVVLICKTTDENVKKTIKRIKKLHPYDVPDVIVLPIIGGLKEYLEYLTSQTL